MRREREREREREGGGGDTRPIKNKFRDFSGWLHSGVTAPGDTNPSDAAAATANN